MFPEGGNSEGSHVPPEKEWSPQLLQHYSCLGVRCPSQVTCVNTWSTELAAQFRETEEPLCGRAQLGEEASRCIADL